jgi:hypothetical protein
MWRWWWYLKIKPTPNGVALQTLGLSSKFSEFCLGLSWTRFPAILLVFWSGRAGGQVGGQAGAGEIKNKAYSVQLQLKLQTGSKLGKNTGT